MPTGRFGLPTPLILPAGLRWFSWLGRALVKTRDKFTACLDCGFFWSEVEPQELRAVIEKYGTEETKQKLAGNQP
jgi:hypothetical protein